MIAKPFASLFFILCMVWLGSIFISSDPQLRIERTCAPISWTGKLAGSVMSLIGPDLERDTLKGFFSTEQGCQYVIFRQFYEEDVSAKEARIKELEALIEARQKEITASSEPQKGKGQ